MKILIILILFLYASFGNITNHSVDDVKTGMTISEFIENKKDYYEIIQETINLEGNDYPIFNVYQNSEIIYAVESDGFGKEVCRIWVYGKEFKTDLGIGIENTLGDLRETYTVEEVITGEGNVAILVKEIEVSFLLETSYISDEWWYEMKMEKLKNEIPIKLIIV